MTRSQKTSAAMAVAFFLALGGFTVGQAQGAPALGVFLAAELSHALPGGVIQLHSANPSLGSITEAGGLAPGYKYQAPHQQVHLPTLRANSERQALGRLPIPQHKVSLHVLQSVFLL